MATHSSVLAWRIPGTGEPGGLPSIGAQSLAQSRTRLKQLSSSSSSTLSEIDSCLANEKIQVLEDEVILHSVHNEQVILILE